jgi:hypothetical protein
MRSSQAHALFRPGAGSYYTSRIPLASPTPGAMCAPRLIATLQIDLVVPVVRVVLDGLATAACLDTGLPQREQLGLYGFGRRAVGRTPPDRLLVGVNLDGNAKGAAPRHSWQPGTTTADFHAGTLVTSSKALSEIRLLHRYRNLEWPLTGSAAPSVQTQGSSPVKLFSKMK